MRTIIFVPHSRPRFWTMRSAILIVAPRFASNSSAPGNEAGHCGDRLAPNEANWFCDNQRPDTWRSGGTKVGDPALSSLEFIDQIVRQLSDKRLFPNLSTVVIAGHSAGGQFVIRYSMTNAASDAAGVSISYVVANPSSYPYLDATRPTLSALPGNVSATAPGFHPPPPANPPPPFVAFADAQNCTGFDDWPYGLRNRRGYVGRLTTEEIKARAASRSIAYVLGDSDILASGVFDASCPAMAQGPTRVARGLAFVKYMNDAVDFRSRCPFRPQLMSNSSCALRFTPFPGGRSIESADILAANWPDAAPTTDGSPERIPQTGPLVDLVGWRRMSGPMLPYDTSPTRRARSKARRRALSDS